MDALFAQAELSSSDEKNERIFALSKTDTEIELGAGSIPK